ncbi:hypothetical protein SeLEV6574_g04955 [Synchytrium endobioticum]|uniref:Uncharacterized protein n=1 Tax=Synchytrium endobioticum TaxID=286115 RepID=A0A507CX27_9FUNG|nr:hypothetical protein SeLEV6574_g04955 [Synchytrium endobioticum]
MGKRSSIAVWVGAMLVLAILGYHNAVGAPAPKEIETRDTQCGWIPVSQMLSIPAQPSGRTQVPALDAQVQQGTRTEAALAEIDFQQRTARIQTELDGIQPRIQEALTFFTYCEDIQQELLRLSGELEQGRVSTQNTIGSNRNNAGPPATGPTALAQGPIASLVFTTTVAPISTPRQSNAIHPTR